MESSDDEQLTVSKPKKKIVTIQSDSEASDDEVESKNEAENDKKDASESESEAVKTDAKEERKKFTKLQSDSESDKEDDEEMKSDKKIKKRTSTFANDDSDSENDDKNLDDKDQGSSEDEGVKKDNNDSSPSNSGSDEELDEDEQIAKIEEAAMKSKKKVQKRQDRKSKAAALQEIYSESNRMFRESGIKVNYHRPKQRTLDEFLNRRKKSVIDQVIGDDIKFRKTPKNLDEVQQKLQECEKYTEEFFKSDNEDLEQDEVNNDSGIATNASSQVQIEPNENSTEIEANEDQPVVEENKDTEDPKEANETNEESLKLFLEPDTEPIANADDEIIPSSQKQEVEQSISELKTPVLAKKLEHLGKSFDISSDILSKKPTLKPDSNDSEIILDGDAKQEASPMDTFVERFFKHAKADGRMPAIKGRKKNVDITIVSKETNEKGEEKLQSSTIQYQLSDIVSKVKNVDRPGAQLIALKNTLKAKMWKKRLEERQKLEAEQPDNEEENEVPEEELESDMEDEEEEEYEESSEGESEPPESDEDAYVKGEKKFKRVKSAFIDDEAEEDDEDFHLSLADDEDENEAKETENFATPSLESGRTMSKINTPFSGLDTEQIPRWTPYDQRTQTQPDRNASGDVRKKLGFESLFDTSDPNVAEIDDVIGLCSGQFVTQKPVVETQAESAEDSQVPIEGTPDTVLLTQSNRAESQILSQTDLPMSQDLQEIDSNMDLSTPNINASIVDALKSDDDEDQEDVDKATKAVVAKKKAKRLVLSDDEESDNDDGDEETVESDIENEPEVEQKEVMYDSEENEIEAPPVVEEKFKGFRSKKGIRKEFLENEAELSGSDIGSDDEDERGLDKLLLEEGDLDDIDEDAVRDEVGRLHHRQILDQDKREVRLFQEAFLEDGELHSDNARSRKFRWKNIDDDNVDLSLRNSDSENDNEELSEQEEKRRLERLEREKWIQENEAKDKTKKVEDEDDDSQFFNMASKALKRLNSRKSIINETSSGTNLAAKRKEFKSPKAKTPLQILSGNNQKGSFLSRESETLEKLAEMTKGKSEAKTGTTAKNTNNFVFAAVSPPPKNNEDTSRATGEQHKRKKKNATAPTSKRAKVDRTLDENSQTTIFGLL